MATVQWPEPCDPFDDPGASGIDRWTEGPSPMRADSLFIPLQGGAAEEAVTRSPGRAGVATDGAEAFAGLLAQTQGVDRQTVAPARPGHPEPNAWTDTPSAPESDKAADDATSAKPAGISEDASTEPLILPHNPPVTGTEGGKEGSGPQILPGEDGKARSDAGPQILPHNPPVTEERADKERTGPQVLPGEQPAPGRVKGTHLPQANPGRSAESPSAVEEAETRVPPAAPSQGAAKALSDGQAAAPLAPALARRLLATHEAREHSASRGPEGPDLGARLKGRMTSHAAPSALQGDGVIAPAPGPSPFQAATMTVVGRPGQTPAGSPAASPLPVSADSPAPLTGDATASDSFKVALASADRGSGLSTLSRATVETTALIAAQIQNRLNGRSTRFEMALTPEGLGRVDVSLEIDSDGRLAARLAFDNPAAATELRGRADELRRQLEQAGLHLDGDALQFTERDPSSADRGFSGFDRRAFVRASDLNDRADQPIAEPATWHSLSLTRDRVDLKV